MREVGREEVGRREAGGEIFEAEKGLKNPWAGEEDVFLVHPQNSLNGLILNWCTGGCWFTPALLRHPATTLKQSGQVFKLN